MLSVGTFSGGMIVRKIHIAGASALALSVALASGNASATPTGPRVVSVNVADYNSAQVTTANGILTVPAGLATYTVNSGTLEINSRFTVTLPSGFSFSSQPSLGATSATTFTLNSGGIGSQSATFGIAALPLVPGQSAALNSFAIQGATALENPIPVAAALPISVQSTNNAEIDNNDPKPLSAGAFASEPGAVLEYAPSIIYIDLSTPALGTSFFAYADVDLDFEYEGPPDTLTAGLMEIEIVPQMFDAATFSVPVLSPNGSPNTLSTSDTATVTAPGLFNGISSAFFSATDDCQGTPSATGTATPTQVTVPGIPFGTLGALCITANGTTLLQANLQAVESNFQAFAPVLTPGSNTDFLGGVDFNEEEGFPGFITYIGGGIISVTNFFTGDDLGLFFAAAGQ